MRSGVESNVLGRHVLVHLLTNFENVFQIHFELVVDELLKSMDFMLDMQIAPSRIRHLRSLLRREAAQEHKRGDGRVVYL